MILVFRSLDFRNDSVMDVSLLKHCRTSSWLLNLVNVELHAVRFSAPGFARSELCSCRAAVIHSVRTTLSYLARTCLVAFIYIIPKFLLNFC